MKITERIKEFEIGFELFITHHVNPVFDHVVIKQKERLYESYKQGLEVIVSKYNELSKELESLTESSSNIWKDEVVRKTWSNYISMATDYWKNTKPLKSDREIILAEIAAYATQNNINPVELAKSIFTQMALHRIHMNNYQKAFDVYEKNTRFQKMKAFFKECFTIDDEFFRLYVQVEKITTIDANVMKHNFIQAKATLQQGKDRLKSQLKN